MLLDALLAYAHFISLFSAYALLAAELIVHGQPSFEGKWVRLARLDMGFFISAIALLLTGLGRVFFGLKGAAYYWHDLWFYAPWITYALIGLLSIVPTLSYIRWSRQEKAAPAFAPGPRELRNVHNNLRLELILFTLAPVFAVLMARGYGI